MLYHVNRHVFTNTCTCSKLRTLCNAIQFEPDSLRGILIAYYASCHMPQKRFVETILGQAQRLQTQMLGLGVECYPHLRPYNQMVDVRSENVRPDLYAIYGNRRDQRTGQRRHDQDGILGSAASNGGLRCRSSSVSDRTANLYPSEAMRTLAPVHAAWEWRCSRLCSNGMIPRLCDRPSTSTLTVVHSVVRHCEQDFAASLPSIDNQSINLQDGGKCKQPAKGRWSPLVFGSRQDHI